MEKINHKEINNLVLLWQKETDDQRRDDLWDRIYSSQESMIKMFISDASIRMGQAEDLKQELIYSMLECMNRFKGDKGANFNTYLLFYLRKGRFRWSSSSRTVSIHQRAENKDISFTQLESDDEEKTTKDVLLSTTDWNDNTNKLDLKKKLDLLKGEDLDIVLLFLDGYKSSEIAEKLSLKTTYIYARLRRIKEIMKNGVRSE